MPRDNEPAIEVEVLEIDGAAPPPAKAPPGAVDPLAFDADDSRPGQARANWPRWPGQVRTLHPLWWPVLLVGGGLLLAGFLTIGLVMAILLAIYRIVRWLLRALVA